MRIDKNIIFVLEKRKDQNGNIKPQALIKMRVKYNKNIIDFSIGYKADVSKWINGSCKAGTTHNKISAVEINTEISRLQELAEDVFKAFEVDDRMPTTTEYKDAFNRANGKEIAPAEIRESKLTFFNYFDIFTKENGKLNDWTESTYEKFYAVKNHLTAFKSDLSFEDLTDIGL